MRIGFIRRVLSTAILVVVLSYAGTCNGDISKPPDVASTVEDFLDDIVVPQLGVYRNPKEAMIGVRTLRGDDTSYVKSLTRSALKKGLLSRGYPLRSIRSQTKGGFIIVVLDTNDIKERVKPRFKASNFVSVFPVVIGDRSFSRSDINRFLDQPDYRSQTHVQFIDIPMKDPEYTAAVQPLINHLNDQFLYRQRDSIVFELNTLEYEQRPVVDAIGTGLAIHGYTNWNQPAVRLSPNPPKVLILMFTQEKIEQLLLNPELHRPPPFKPSQFITVVLVVLGQEVPEIPLDHPYFAKLQPNGIVLFNAQSSPLFVSGVQHLINDLNHRFSMYNRKKIAVKLERFQDERRITDLRELLNRNGYSRYVSAPDVEKIPVLILMLTPDEIERMIAKPDIRPTAHKYHAIYLVVLGQDIPDIPLDNPYFASLHLQGTFLMA